MAKLVHKTLSVSFFAKFWDGEAVLNEKHPDGPKQEHDGGEAEQAVAKPLQWGESLIFGNGFGVHVADAAFFQVAAGGVMDGMGVPPLFAGGEDQNAKPKAYKFVGAFGREEGIVTTIMKEDEDAHK